MDHIRIRAHTYCLKHIFLAICTNCFVQRLCQECHLLSSMGPMSYSMSPFLYALLLVAIYLHSCHKLNANPVHTALHNEHTHAKSILSTNSILSSKRSLLNTSNYLPLKRRIIAGDLPVPEAGGHHQEY
jgi:hypothetical protein